MGKASPGWCENPISDPKMGEKSPEWFGIAEIRQIGGRTACRRLLFSGSLVPGSNIRVEIPVQIATDLMGTSLDRWRIGARGSMEDSTIDDLLNRITLHGASALNNARVLGVTLLVSQDATQTDIKIK